MDIQSVLLGFLMGREMSGYDLKKTFSRSFSFFSGLSFGSIYPALNKMEQRGLITRRVEVQEKAPNRKVYAITQAGREEFLAALRSPLAGEQPKSPFLMRLFFFAHLRPEERKRCVSSYLEAIGTIRKEMELIRPGVEARADRFQRLCFQFGSRFFQDLADNLAHVIKELDDDLTEGKR